MKRHASLALGLALVVGCSSRSAQEPFGVVVKVEGDPGKPVAGAAIARGQPVLAVTDAQGLATLRLTGVEGELTDVTVACPQGFASPTNPLGIKLVRLADGNLPQYTVQCPPSVRRIVVAVRAENGANLPVTYLTQSITRTDGSGAASFTLEVAPGAQFTVALDTSERKELRPSNPSKLFVVKAEDDVFLFDQKFEIKKAPAPPALPVVPSPPSTPHGRPKDL